MIYSQYYWYTLISQVNTLRAILSATMEFPTKDKKERRKEVRREKERTRGKKSHRD